MDQASHLQALAVATQWFETWRTTGNQRHLHTALACYRIAQERARRAVAELAPASRDMPGMMALTAPQGRAALPPSPAVAGARNRNDPTHPHTPTAQSERRSARSVEDAADSLRRN